MILANFLRGKNIRLLFSAFLISFRYCILELRPRLPSSAERKRRLTFLIAQGAISALGFGYFCQFG